MDDLLKVKERIQKLLAMAKDTSSPEEAAIAAGRARKLLDKYQIDESSLSGLIEDIFGSVSTEAGFLRNVPRHFKYLAVGIAKFNDCIADFDIQHTERGEEKHIQFKGYSTDADLCMAMFNDLLAYTETAAAAYKKAGGAGSKAIFLQACVVRIRIRLEEICKERDEVMSSGTSLIVVKAAAVEEEFGEARYKKSKGRSVQNPDEDAQARTAGHNAGDAAKVVKELD